MTPPVVDFDNVSFAFDDNVVLRNVSFSVPAGSMRVFLGGSGAGKSIILKLIMGLYRPDSGRITVHGHRIDQLTERELLEVRTDIGILFQETALFDSLTVEENVGYRLFEETEMPLDEVRTRVQEVLGFVGLGEYGARLPSELSGGQKRRVAIARAMASKPSLLLFDDPTTGLDPVIATDIDEEIVKLRDLERVTSILVTHQMRDAYYIAQHEAVRSNGHLKFVNVGDAKAGQVKFLVLHDAEIRFEGSAEELLASEDPYLKEFLYKTLPPW